MKIFIVVYRIWTIRIISDMINSHKKTIKLNIFTSKKNEFSKSDIKKFNIRILSKNNKSSLLNYLQSENPDIIFFLGWSSFVKEIIYNKFLCVCLHPSMLPSFRGGSPLQNQIIRNKIYSGLSLFKINKRIDGGPISHQTSLILKGNMNIIFKQIQKKSIYLINLFIKDFKNKKLTFKKQNLHNTTIYKRRKPEESFFSISSIKDKKYTYFNNFINMLTDPYPNAYTIIGSKKISIQKIKRSNKTKNYLKDINLTSCNNANNLLIKLKDCNVEILKSKVYL